jgi:hypothetical protein
MRRILLAFFALAVAVPNGNGQVPDARRPVLAEVTLTPSDFAAEKPMRQTAAGDLPAANGPLPPPAETPLPRPAEAPSFIERLGTYYDHGFVLMKSSDSATIPFELVFNAFAQMRYTNTQLDSFTYTDHLGDVHDVRPRNDISFNREMLLWSGYVFDPRWQYTLGFWASSANASVIGVGAITWEFDKAFTLNAGYTGLPGSRSLLGGYKDLHGIDRSMADTFFRPGFTTGSWVSGEPLDGLHYDFMIGNSINTLNIATSKIDANLAYAGSVWWEPLGVYGPIQAFNDLEKHQTPVIRVGSSFTHSREDRFSDSTATNNPDNTQIYNSDGVNFFSTGSLAHGVTIQLADYDMWAIDAGFKYNGFAVNGQYYFRWLSGFRADGPLPISSTFDNGFEASVGNFFWPKLELYARTSFVFGQFGDSHEVCGGFNWYPLENRAMRVAGEVGRVDHSPVGNIVTPYQAGQSGWMFVLQAQIQF